MLRNYFVLFFRNLTRQKLFSIFNVLGLTAGIATTLVIYLYVRGDFSHDRFHEHADRIYRVNQSNILGESDQQLARTGPGVANALKTELPEVEMITSLHTPGPFLVSYVNESNQVIADDQESIFAADSNFFRMFNFEITNGNRETCLLQPQTVVITEPTAKKYFGTEQPLGKMLLLGSGENARPFEVTGVTKDIPDNSYIKFDMVISMSSIPRVKANSWSWIWTQMETFLLLDKNSDIEHTRSKLAPIPRRYSEGSLQGGMSMSFDEFLKTGKSWELYLQPLTEIHLYSDNVVGNSNVTGNIRITYSLVGAAAFIILLSCINFMNLSTAQLTRRLKEASIRKVLGLGRAELSFSYFFEAFVFCLVALICALALIQIMLPWFNTLTGKLLDMNLVRDYGLILVIILLLFSMSALSGSFPAFVISSFRPSEALKGKLKTGRDGRRVRNGLVVLQYILCIVLIINTTIVFQQLTFFASKDLGFNRENLLVIDHLERVGNGASLTNAISNVPGVQQTSFCTSTPMYMGSDVFKPGHEGHKDFKLHFATADQNYLVTLGAPLVIGRNFSGSSAADKDGVILNETAVRNLGWNLDDSVIGKIIYYPNESTQFEVIGVVRDYHFTSLEAEIQPMAIFHIDSKVYSQRKFALIRINRQEGIEWDATLANLKNVWKQHAGDLPFKYTFVDQTFAAKLQTQRQFGKTLQVMAGLALLIACLGLFGMVIYTLEQRTKEIGIRKISGAGVWNILVLVSKGYAKLIFLAFAIGTPISYWLIERWLRDFANRITPSASVFILTGLGILLFSFLITSYHSIKAALANPIDALRDE